MSCNRGETRPTKPPARPRYARTRPGCDAGTGRRDGGREARPEPVPAAYFTPPAGPNPSLTAIVAYTHTGSATPGQARPIQAPFLSPRENPVMTRIPRILGFLCGAFFATWGQAASTKPVTVFVAKKIHTMDPGWPE